MLSEVKIVLRSKVMEQSAMEDLADVVVENLQVMECVVEGKVLIEKLSLPEGCLVYPLTHKNMQPHS